MERPLIGEFEQTTYAGETVRAYVPSALPPDPPIVMDADLQGRHDRALLECGRLDGIASVLPETSVFLYSYVRREAVLSSQIEGTQSSLSDLLLFELDEVPGVPFDDVREVSQYVAALEHGIARLAEGFPLSNRLVREVHERLMTGGRGAEKMPGMFRTTQNWIGGTRPGNAHYVPPPAHRVMDCMSDLEKYLHAPDVPALVKAALTHVQFESIHPFLDGNGRAGRLLIALLLYHEHIMRQPLLYLSLYLKKHRSEYYRLLDHVRTTGDWEQWLGFFFDGVHETAKSAVETADRLRTLFASDEQRLRSAGIKPSTVHRALRHMQSRPIATVRSLASDLGLAFPTAAKALQTLCDVGITQEATGRRRNRIYVYGDYLDILNEGAEV